LSGNDLLLTYSCSHRLGCNVTCCTWKHPLCAPVAKCYVKLDCTEHAFKSQCRSTRWMRSAVDIQAYLNVTRKSRACGVSGWQFPGMASLRHWALPAHQNQIGNQCTLLWIYIVYTLKNIRQTTVL